jgi:hypothetical protein
MVCFEKLFFKRNPVPHQAVALLPIVRPIRPLARVWWQEVWRCPGGCMTGGQWQRRRAPRPYHCGPHKVRCSGLVFFHRPCSGCARGVSSSGTRGCAKEMLQECSAALRRDIGLEKHG